MTKEDYGQMADGMKRYWDIKSKNMDKILFWRFGEWYVVYYDDLTNCAKCGIDLVITPFPQRWPPRVGFEATSLERSIGLMTEAGFRVAVCEQKETHEQMENRVAAAKDEIRMTRKEARAACKEKKKKEDSGIKVKINKRPDES